MTKQELYDEVNKKISLLTNKLENPPKEYKFYADFVNNYKLKNINEIIKIPYMEFVTALLYATFEEEEDFTEFCNNINKCRFIYEGLSSIELSDMSHFFLGFINAARANILINIFNDSNKKRAANEIKRVFEHSTNVKDAEDAYRHIEKLVVNNGKYGWDVSCLIEYFRRDRFACTNVTESVSVLKDAYDEKQKNGSISKELLASQNIKNILNLCERIIECKKIQSADWKKKETGIRDKLGKYKKFLREMDAAFQKEEITNYANIIRDIDDERIKLAFLKLVYQHNRIRYEEIDTAYESLSKNSIVNYLTLLKNNGIKKDEVDLIKLSKNTCEDLEKMLKILNAIVGNKDIIIRIIETSDLDNVMYFKELKTKGVLSTKAFLEYPEIFDANSVLRKVLDKNIEAMNNYSIDSTIFSKNPESLIDNIYLEENLEVLDSYGLISGLKSDKKYKFLKSCSLCEKIDKIIELGYGTFLADDISLLNEKNWDRIYVLKNMGLKPESKSELLKCLRDDKFFVSDDKLHLYIEDASKYYDGLGINYDTDMSRIVSDYSTGKYTLCFDRVVISKNRVSRNITSKDFDINELFRAIIKDSILSNDEINTIKSILKSKTYKID